MNLIILAAFVAIAGAAKLDRHYLPPPSAKTAGGRPEDLQLPFAKNSLDQGPKGSSVNEFDGVVVDAALETAGPRQTDETGLGGPRNSYGSTNSKVGEAAFAAQPAAGFRLSPDGTGFDALHSASTENEVPQAFRESAVPQGFNGQFQRFTQSKDHAANTLRFENDVQSDRFKYAYDTDNGISASAIGVEANGVQAQGGFSYKSDDGQVYSVMYTADEGGYQPKGDHLPTPPPIPEEILRSIEQNARDEAAGVVDDGSYDATKYNAEGDYTESGNTNGQYNAKPLFSQGNRLGLAASGLPVNGNNGFVNSHLNGAGDANANISVQGQSEKIFADSNGRPGSNTAHLGIFDQTSSNNFGNSNEYLPPIRAGYTGKPQRPSSVSSNINNAFQTPFSNFANKPSQSQSNGQGQSYSQTFQTNNQPGNNFQFSHYNGFQQKPGFELNKPTQLSQATQGQNALQFGSVSTIVPQFGIQSSSTTPPLISQEQEQFNPLATNSLPTGQPSIELSTPFETREYESNKDTNVQSQPSNPSSSGFGSFTLQNLANHPSQNQLNSQLSGNHQNGLGVTASPSIVSTSLNVQLPNSRPQGSNNYRPFSVSSSSLGTQFGNKLPFSQGQTSNIQVSSTTQAPFGLNSQSQGQEAYQYNQPSKPYNGFFSRPQGQNLLNNQANQFGSGITSQGNLPFNFAQAQGNNRYPNPSTISPINQNSPFPSIKPNYNGITQASASSFDSVSPTQSLFGNNKNSGAFSGTGSFAGFQQNGKLSSTVQQPKKPIQFQQSIFSTTAGPLEQTDIDKNQPLLSANSEPSSLGQQYNGELYEYNKPEQTLPAPDSQDTTSTDKNGNGQSLQSGNQPQFQGNTDTQGSASFQFSSQQPFARPQFGQNSVTNGNVQSLSQVPLQQGSRPFGLSGQFGQQFGQKIPQSGTQGPLFGNGLTQNKYSQTNGNLRPIGACCQPSASLQISQPTQSTQNAVNPDLSKKTEELPTGANPDVPSAQSVAGQGEIFGSPNRKPPSFDKSGYHY